MKYRRIFTKKRILTASLSALFIVIVAVLNPLEKSQVFAAVTVDTSLIPETTNYSFQRKIWHDGTYHWIVFQSDGQLEFWYSLNGVSWTENATARISIPTAANASVVADSSSAYVIYYDNGGQEVDIEIRKATSYPSTSFGWGTQTVVFDGNFDDAPYYFYPMLIKDSNNKLRVFATKESASLSLTITSRLSANADDITAWGGEETVDATSANPNRYTTAVSLGGGNAYAVWIDGTAIEGKKNTGGTWDTNPTSIATGVTGEANLLSMVSNTSTGEAYLVYINSSGHTVFQKYSSGSWQTAVTLDSSAANQFPVISINPSNNDLYAFWIRSNTIYYKKGISAYTSGSWDVSATSLISSGTNKYLISANQSASGRLFIGWTEGTGPTYNVKSEFLSLQSAPAAPTLVQPTASQTGVSILPQLRASATDSDGDYLKYWIDICSTSNCSSVVRSICQENSGTGAPGTCTESQTGWLSQSTQLGTAYASGQTAVHQYQAAALTANTQYWWRAYAVDPGGSNTWSSTSSIGTFTTGAAVNSGSPVEVKGGTNIKGGTKIGN